MSDRMFVLWLDESEEPSPQVKAEGVEVIDKDRQWRIWDDATTEFWARALQNLDL